MSNKRIGVTKKDRSEKGLTDKKKEKQSTLLFDTILFLTKEVKEHFNATFYTSTIMSSKCVEIKGYSFFKIPVYFNHMGQETFMTLDADFVYPGLICMFFVNAIIDKDILTITSFVKEKYLS